MDKETVNFKMRLTDFEKLETLGGGDPDLGLERILKSASKHYGKQIQTGFDNADKFISEYVVKCEGHNLQLSQVFKWYKEFSVSNGLFLITKGQFIQRMVDKGFLYGTGGGNSRVFYDAYCDWL